MPKDTVGGHEAGDQQRSYKGDAGDLFHGLLDSQDAMYFAL